MNERAGGGGVGWKRGMERKKVMGAEREKDRQTDRQTEREEGVREDN